MNSETYSKYTNILRRELIPATGCTEPIALAWAAALGRELLGGLPEAADVYASGSIIKNVKSVVVPGTDGMKGIEAAIAAGLIAGDAAGVLEVLAHVGPQARADIAAYLQRGCIRVHLADTEESFDVLLALQGGGHTARVRIAGHHTNVVLRERDGQVLEEHLTTLEHLRQHDSGDAFMSIAEIYEYAGSCALADVEEVIQRQIDCNTALSDAGLTGSWGAQIGRLLMAHSTAEDVLMHAKARAAAGSDARMSGCELPAVINSGSGNQGLTITLPIVEYARALGVERERLIRALVLANLSSIRIKKEIGCLSAYCGAVCAGCAAGAGVAYLHGADRSLVEHTIVNGLAILSGTICDGAKPSCAAKIAMAVEAGIMGYEMAAGGHEFFGGDGIIKKGIENTIAQIGTLGRDGMLETNRVVLNIMLGE